MGVKLGANNYGKSRVRLLRVSHLGQRDDVHELTLAISLEGDFETAHTIGDNSKVLPTDTMKNTVYALARQNPIDSQEGFASLLVAHFLKGNPQATRVQIETSENLWARMPHIGAPYPSAFVRAGSELRTSVVTGTRQETTFQSGIQDLVAMKTAGSAFEGFMRDAYTTLKEDRDRILATSIRASWLYSNGPIDFNSMWESVHQTLLETFADHNSLSVQHTLYSMGEAVLNRFESVREIRLSLPNKHYNLVDLSKFGMDNPAEVFLPIDEPHGLIEATIVRS